MTKYLFILLLFFVFTGCEYKESVSRSEQKELFYPSQEKFDFETELAEVYLDSVENYAQLYKQLEKNACEGNTSVIKFLHQGQQYNIIGYAECPEDAMIVCFFRVNQMYINSDSLRYDYDVLLPVDRFGDALSDLMLNPHNYKFQSTSLKNAVIWFYVEEKYSIEFTKELLVKITGEFEKINKEDKNKFPYNISFERREYKIPPPPPPPPPSENEDIY